MPDTGVIIDRARRRSSRPLTAWLQQVHHTQPGLAADEV